MAISRLNVFLSLFLIFTITSLSGQILVLKQEKGKLLALTDEDQKNYLGVQSLVKEEKSEADSKDKSEDKEKVENKKEEEQDKKQVAQELPLPDCKTIFGILHMYQWPSSTLFAPRMTHDEKQELFASEVDAEVKFIQKKIKANVDQKYKAIYIPNIIYELFFIYTYCFKRFEDKYSRQLAKFRNPAVEDYEQKIHMFDSSDRQDFFDTILHRFYTFNDATKQFNCILNQALGEYYLTESAEYQKKHAGENNEEDLFSFIIARLVHKLLLCPEKWTRARYNLNQLILELFLEDKSYDLDQRRSKLAESKSPTLDLSKPISRSLKYEIEARKSNKALLFRCAKSFILKNDASEKEKAVELLDSSLSISFDKMRSLKYRGHSLSYNNSLCCCWVNDNYLENGGACTYTYIARAESYCYVFLVDKHKYITDRVDNLLCITPLMPLAGIIGRGEFIHSRGTVCLSKPSEIDEFGIGGIDGNVPSPAYDQHNYLFIQRDPLRHASMVSHFLGNNLRIIKAPDKFNGAIAEREKLLRQGQCDAAKIYSTMLEKRLAKEKDKEVVAAQGELPQGIDDEPLQGPLNKKAKTV